MSIILYKAIPAEKKFIFSAGVFTLPYVTLAYAVLNFLSRRDEKDAALNADKNKTTSISVCSDLPLIQLCNPIPHLFSPDKAAFRLK